MLVFHGGGGTGPGTERLTRFTALADREGFLVAFPEGVEKNWNDGREFTGSRAHRDHVDDVAFVTALIDAIGRAHAVDPRRVYATGISNGGIFSHYLAAHLSAAHRGHRSGGRRDRRPAGGVAPTGAAGLGADAPGHARPAGALSRAARSPSAAARSSIPRRPPAAGPR